MSVANVSSCLPQLVQRVFPAELLNLIIDDTLVPRTAKSGSGISIKHGHARKATIGPPS